jgi:hypothetical protein
MSFISWKIRFSLLVRTRTRTRTRTLSQLRHVYTTSDNKIKRNFNIQSDEELLQFSCKSRNSSNAYAMCFMQYLSPHLSIYTMQ